MHQRPQSAQQRGFVDDKKEEISATLESKSPLVTLKLSANPRLQSIFPNDPHSDITINFHNKQYNLQRAHLRLETDYFHGKTREFKIKDLQLPFQQFDNILHCLYGSVYCVKKQGEFYNAYHVSKQLRIDSLVQQMDNAIISNFHNFNFFVVFQLGEVYHNEELRQLCLEFLESNQQSYQTLLDLNQAKCHLIKTNQLFTKLSEIESQPPTNILLLNEGCFKNLLRLHNSYKVVNNQKQYFLPYDHVYQLINLYVECRVPELKDQELHKQIVRAMVLDLIDKKTLNSKEYRTIYHSDLLLPRMIQMQDSFVQEEPSIQSMNNTIVNNTRSFKDGNDTTKDLPNQPDTTQSLNKTMSSFNLTSQQKGQIFQAFDPILSENYLTKIEVLELKEENASLLGEVAKLKNFLEQSVQHDYKLSSIDNNFKQQMGLMQSHFTQLDIRLEEKIGGLQQDLKEVQTELQEKKQLVIQREHTIRRLEQELNNLHQQKAFSNTSEDLNDRDMEENQNENGVTQSQFNVDDLHESESRLYNDNDQIMQEYAENTQVYGIESVNLDKSQINVMIQTTQSEYVQVEADNNIQNLEDSSFMQSEFLIIQQQSQLRSQNLQQNSSILSLQFTQQQRFSFDYEPGTIDNTQQLNFLADQLNISIFQKAEMRSIYIGSRDGYRSIDFLRNCGGHSKILVLIKSWDYDKNFGLFINQEVQDTGDQFVNNDGFLFSVSHTFIVPFSRIQIGNKSLLQTDDLIIGNNCTEELSCVCVYPKLLTPIKQFKFTHLCGAQNFQVDEIEAYSMCLTSKMD